MSRGIFLEGRIHTTPLIEAVKSKDIDQVKFLIKTGAVIDEADTFNKTPLVHAIINGSTEIMLALIEAGAKINGFDMINPPIKDAISNNNIDAFKLLLEKGAETSGLNLIHHAIIYMPKIIPDLIKCGVNVFEKNYNGETPLQYVRHISRIATAINSASSRDEKYSEMIRILEDAEAQQLTRHESDDRGGSGGGEGGAYDAEAQRAEEVLIHSESLEAALVSEEVFDRTYLHAVDLTDGLAASYSCAADVARDLNEREKPGESIILFPLGLPTVPEEAEEPESEPNPEEDSDVDASDVLGESTI